MTRSDILVMGELNVDLILGEISSFPKIGTEILANKMVLALGSSSAIFASNAAAMSAQVSFLGKLGTDYFGEFILDALKKNKVDTSSILRSPEHATGATVALVYGEDRAMVTHPGAMNFLSGADLSTALLPKFRHFHLSSVFLQPLVKRDLEEILQRAKSCGLSTSLDTQWDPLEKWDLDLAKILPHIDVFMPNAAELGRQPLRTKEILTKHQDRIMFGSDFDLGESMYANHFRWLETKDEYFDYWGYPAQGRWKIYGLGLSDKILKKVYHENAERILGLKR